MRIACRRLIVIGLTLAVSSQVAAIPPAPETQARVRHASRKGVEYLLARQQEDGAWVNHAAVTALACMALMSGPTAAESDVHAAVERGLDYVTRFAQPDGSIWNKEAETYPAYTTAVSLVALALRNRSKDAEIIRKARRYIIGTQFADAAGDGDFYGGIGYGRQERPDLSNTQWALEALYATDYLDREPFLKDPEHTRQTDLAWERALTFLSHCQNLAETNDSAWVMTDPDNRGGFVYKPDESKAGDVQRDAKAAGLRSYGSMTYAGLKSLVYARLDREDIRVKAAVEWLGRHFGFASNPGMGDAGLYYYLITAAKALDAYGAATITDGDGKPRHWRSELLEQLTGTQRPDGGWLNANGRWMESIPELSTAYSLIALHIAAGYGGAP